MLNRREAGPPNPYDAPPPRRDLADALRCIRHADALHRAGRELGREYPDPTPERVAASLERLGLGKAEVRRTARREGAREEPEREVAERLVHVRRA